MVGVGRLVWGVLCLWGCWARDWLLWPRGGRRVCAPCAGGRECTQSPAGKGEAEGKTLVCGEHPSGGRESPA